MKFYNSCLMAAVLLSICTMASAQSALLHQTFEDGLDGWAALGMGAKVAVDQEPGIAKEGKAALQISYSIQKGQIGLAVDGIPPGTLAGAQSVRFWVKADYTAPLVFTMQEHLGGRYIAMFTAPKGVWQEVDLSPSDFVLSEDSNDPKDPDNKLDMDQIEGIGIVDIGQLFAQADPSLSKILSPQTGGHVLYLDDLTISTQPLAGTQPPASVIDQFSRPQVCWLGLGGMSLTKANGKPLDGPGLQAVYDQSPGTIAGVVHPVGHGQMAGAGRLLLDVAASKGAKLVVQVEERDGGKYNTFVDLPGDSTVKHLDLAFADFKPAPDSNDSNGTLDMDQVKQVLVLDATGLTGAVDQENTLWVGNVRTAPAK